MRTRISLSIAWAFLSLLAASLFNPKALYAGIYNSNKEVTYKEYWVPHSQFTGGILEDPNTGEPLPDCPPSEPNGSVYLEAVGTCTKTVTLDIPDDFSRALKAELYLDLWRNHAPHYDATGQLLQKASAAFQINGSPYFFESHPVGDDFSRTPFVTDTVRASDSAGVVIPVSVTPLKTLLRTGANTIVFKQLGGAFHIHDIAIRIYFDNHHPLLDPAGQPLQAPNGELKTIWHDGGLADAKAGGTLIVNDDQLLLTAEIATAAKFVEFHGFYTGYDEDNNDADHDHGALDTDWHNLGRNNWHPGGIEAAPLGGTIDHIGTVATPQPGQYSVYWDISHILSQSGVRFKLRIVSKDNVVREMAGGPSGVFTLHRSRAMTAFWSANRWDDFILWSGGTKAATVTRTITLPASLVVSDYDEAYLIGAYWKNPYLSLNFLPQFRVFPAASEEWALLVRKLPDVTYFQAGLNNFQYGHVSGFGEFVEKPGPLMILKQATRIIDKTPPAITEQTPPAFANEVDPATAVVIKIADPGRGVNAHSLKLLIDDLPVTPQITGTPDEYTLTFVPPTPFPLNALVTVRVAACDYAAKCLAANNGTYTFRTLRGEYSFAAVPDGRGTVAWTPAKALYKYGDAITLTATAHAGWALAGWTAAQANWADVARRYRLPVRVAANGYSRSDKVVETAVNFTSLFAHQGESAEFDPATLRVVEVDGHGQTLDSDVPFQFDPAEGYDPTTNAAGVLLFVLKDLTPADGVRDYHVYFDRTGTGLTLPPFPDLVVRSEEMDEGQESFKVATTNATWYYHKFGGGFSSLVDVDGNDWLGFHPTPTSGGGFFRGIPNLVPPNALPPPYEGGIFHPGKNDATTVGLASGPLKETIRTTTTDGQWVLQWDFFPSFARMTLLQKPANRSYWFLTESTPGGEGECAQRPCDLESDDFWTLPDGRSQSLYQPISDELSAPEWIYFSDPDVDGPSQAARSLFVIHHEDDLVYDTYSPFEDKKMTVFGFGRRSTDNEPGLTVTPSVFTVGLMDETAIEPATATINAAYQALWVAHGGVEALSIPGHPTTSALSLTVSANTIVTATFGVTAAGIVVPNINGQVQIEPLRALYQVGDQVMLRALPNPGWAFSEWRIHGVVGAANGNTSQNPLPVLIDGVTTYEPVFRPVSGIESTLYLPLISQP